MTTEEMTPQARCARAREKLAQGHVQEAFREIRPVLAYPAAPEGAVLHDALDVLREVGEELVGDHFRDLLAWARDHKNDAEALYDAGYALYEQKLHDLAAGLLARANRVAPGSTTIVTELAANLEALMLHRHAAEVLRASGLVETDAMCRYLYGFNALMAGEVDAARPVAEAMRKVDDHSMTYMGSALAGMIARADAVRSVTKLDARDLAGWHLAINGSVLLHLSPHGFEEPMRGRYALVNDSYARIREGIERLRVALGAAGIEAPRVFALPDRSSRIVGMAAAQILGVPCDVWARGGDREPGIVVAYDLDLVGNADVLEQLRDHRPGQVLFAHASCWTDPFPYAPDVTTYLYQVNTAPWDGGQMTVDRETKKITKSEPDLAPIEEIAARIVAAPSNDESVSTRAELAALVSAARAVTGDAAAGLFRASGPRIRQRTGSPVASHRFA
ncbi:Hypothetical protein A7982_06252 [Minicystis rosea]|nr:Hypothetical protein A7982_06252 [Minicystis rosea]